MAIVQQIDNHFISPLVMQRAVKLHPAVVMLALLAGGTLMGFFGLLLAVPDHRRAQDLCGHVWRRFVLERAPRRGARPAGSPRTAAPGGRRRSRTSATTSSRRRSALGGAAAVAGDVDERRALADLDLDRVEVRAHQGGGLALAGQRPPQRGLQHGQGLGAELVERAVAVAAGAEVDLGDDAACPRGSAMSMSRPRSTP